MFVAGSHNIIHVYEAVIGHFEKLIKATKEKASHCTGTVLACCSLLLRVGAWALLVARFCCNVVGNDD